MSRWKPGTMQKTDAGRTEKDNKFAHLRVLEMKWVQHSLERAEYVDGDRLAVALREQAGKPVPPAVLDYLCRFLEGKISKPKGRKPVPIGEQRRTQMLVRYSYNRYLEWLKARKKRYGDLEGWSLIQGANWWQGPPHERAARMAARRWLYGAESWRHVHNLLSSSK